MINNTTSETNENASSEINVLAKQSDVPIYITAVRTLIVNAEMRNWIFVKVETNQPGLYGWGEATLEWKTRAVVGAVQDLEPLLLGKDPRDTEQLLRVMRKHSFWRLGTIGSTALSGIEIALWDIFAKSLGVSVWRLLGGKTRDQVRVYTHLGMGEMTSVYESLETELLIERASAVIEKGYDAVKVVLIPYTHYTASFKELRHVDTLMRKLREAVGDDVDIMVDFHGRCASTSVALQYIDVLEPYGLLFVEEPVPPGDPQGMKAISLKTNVPLAAGERLIDGADFDTLFQARAVNIAQPDLCRVGGFASAKKIAAMAELAGVGIAPHNPLGPIAGVAALHFDVATPNFVIQEEMTGAVPWYWDVIDSPISFEKGHWRVPDCIGLGVEIHEEVADKHPFKQEVMHTTHAVLLDGTVVDW